MFKKEAEKRGQIEEYLVWIILAVVALGLAFFVIVMLKGQGASLIDKIKSIIPGR